MWSSRRIFGIQQTNHVTNEEVLKTGNSQKQSFEVFEQVMRKECLTNLTPTGDIESKRRNQRVNEWTRNYHNDKADS